MTQNALNRRIGPGLLTAYGVGVMVGAGIYVLVGAVAAQAGIYAPFAFLLAGLIAAPTALSYAEFSTRFPQAAGEALYIAEGLETKALAMIVGVAIVLAGTISAAAVLRGGAGYLQLVINTPTVGSIIVMGLVLTGVAIIGVLESLALAAVFTLVEIIGLVLVIWAGMQAPLSPDLIMIKTEGAGHSFLTPSVLGGIAAGASLAFFAFIGFEDIVNMAEEVRDPSRTMPRAILVSLLITAILYGAVSLVAVRSVGLDQLAISERPLALVWQAGKGGDARFLSAIAVAAALNGVLAQIVMAARVLFGLGNRYASFALFSQAHSRFATPMLATCLVGMAVVLAALTLPVSALAGVTSTVLLGVFIFVNLALIRIKRRAPQAPFRVPMLVPVLGLILSMAALLAMVIPILF